MNAFTTSIFPMEPAVSKQLPDELHQAGFRECQQVPPGFLGTMYVCELPIGFTYVVLPPHPTGLVEAFVGDWLLPQRYFHGMAVGLQQLLRLLS